MTRAYLFLCLTLALSGCFGPFRGLPNSGMRDSRPDEYFTNSKVVELCKAIERGDIDKVNRLNADGADFNTLGKGNMTPLLWAMLKERQANEFAISIALLNRGANPNVVTTRELLPRDAKLMGTSAAQLGLAWPNDELFDAMLEHGADPNASINFSPSPMVVNAGMPYPLAQKVRRLNAMLAKGANIDGGTNHEYLNTPAMEAIERQDIAFCLHLLKKGADPTIRRSGSMDLRHLAIQALAKAPPHDEPLSSDQKAACGLLFDWLEHHGLSMQSTEEELERWKLIGKAEKYEERKKLAEEFIKELNERDKAAREAWQKALAEDRATEAAEGKGAEEAADARK